MNEELGLEAFENSKCMMFQKNLQCIKLTYSHPATNIEAIS